MVVVTGPPRSGTSMVMQTLRLLGMNVVGVPHLYEFGPREFNPGGYWSLPAADYIEGIRDNRYEGRALKVLGGWLKNINPMVVSRIIRCRRRISDSVVSFTRLCNASDPRIACSPPEPITVVMDHEMQTKRFLGLYKGPVLEVDYDIVLHQPAREISRIADFVRMKNANKLRAIENIQRRKPCPSQSR